MPSVKRERIKVHRGYGQKPVLERTQNYKLKESKSKTPKRDEAIREYKHQERMRKMEQKLKLAKAKEKRRREWERKKRDLARRTQGFWGDVSGSPKKKPPTSSSQKKKYVVVGGKAYPVARKKKPKKKKKDLGGGLLDDLNDFTKDFGW